MNPSEKVQEILEGADVGQEVIDQVVNLVDGLAVEVNRECPDCLDRSLKAQYELADGDDLAFVTDCGEER